MSCISSVVIVAAVSALGVVACIYFIIVKYLSEIVHKRVYEGFFARFFVFGYVFACFG